MSNGDPFGDRLDELLQQLESEQTGDLVTEWIVVTAAAQPNDADSTAYRVYSDGSISRILGLLRFATVRAEHGVIADDD